jgi:ABC-type lipoprotein release transport system permease subunit
MIQSENQCTRRFAIVAGKQVKIKAKKKHERNPKKKDTDELPLTIGMILGDSLRPIRKGQWVTLMKTETEETEDKPRPRQRIVTTLGFSGKLVRVGSTRNQGTS